MQSIGTPGLWIGFTAVVALFIQYPGYKLMTAMTQFKGLPFDFMAFFFVFFYGLKTRRDVGMVLAVVLGAAVFANVISGLNGVGLLRLATINEGETTDRVQGVMAEHNQYGAFIAFFIPLLVAAVVANRGWRRLFWLAGSVISFGLLMMTVSRGAFVALAAAAVIGAIRFRQQLLNAKVLGWLFGGLVVGTLVVLGVLFGTSYGATLIDRLLGDSTQIDMWEVSSGRTELWADALGQMMRTPLTLLTGFGWATYFVLPSALPLAPHNTYLWYWFELGLIGVIAFAAILLQLIVMASRSAGQALGGDRAYFVGFFIGMTALAIAIFFVEIYTPWPYIWATAGIVMRLAMIVSDEQNAPVKAPAPDTATAEPKTKALAPDRFGWNAAAAQRGKTPGTI